MNIFTGIRCFMSLYFCLGLLACSPRYTDINARIDENKLVLSDGGQLKVRIIVDSISSTNISFHSVISEVMYLSVVNTLCKKKDFYPSRRSSESYDVKISKSNPKVFNLSGDIELNSSSENQFYKIDFGPLGSVCVPADKASKLYITIIPSEYDTVYRDDKSISVEPLKLIPSGD